MTRLYPSRHRLVKAYPLPLERCTLGTLPDLIMPLTLMPGQMANYGSNLLTAIIYFMCYSLPMAWCDIIKDTYSKRERERERERNSTYFPHRDER